MSPRRVPLLLTALGLAATAVPAQAAARPPLKVCNLITDAGDDSRPLVKSPTIEIVGVDMASGARNVTLVLKLKSTAFETTDPVRFTTATWTISFDLGTDTYATHRHTSYTGEVVEDSMTRNSDKLGTPSVSVSPTAITYTFPRTWIPALSSRSRQVFKDLRASTSMALTGADIASNPTVKYTDKTASCVKTS